MTRPVMSQGEYFAKFHKPPTQEERNRVRDLLESRDMGGYNMIEDEIPLVSYVRSVDTVWNLYIGGAIQVRETNAGEIQYRMGDEIDWTTAGFKEAN